MTGPSPAVDPADRVPPRPECNSRAKTVSSSDTSLRGTLAVRYLSGAIDVVEDFPLQSWRGVCSFVSNAGFTQHLSIISGGECLIVNMPEVARISFSADEAKDATSPTSLRALAEAQS